MGADRELETDRPRRENRVFLLHEFRLGHKATEATNNICSMMGENVLYTLPLTSGSKCGSFKAAQRTRSSIDFTVLSRVAWALFCCSRKTSERIREGMEIWSLDNPRVITTSATTPG
ncbi:unnamed protein product [Adineta ricciae]|uniref:Mos1 transposase HTH domain-containing protein n=1 Tax=Adineta ricciae TaxID=249248 RepID=A0A815X172_ADIRI|nr:unnamed protein product [Adineta ricciae]CAF1550630.1 unnamed protein product [Adineta ricciae]